jgi:spermidine synthase
MRRFLGCKVRGEGGPLVATFRLLSALALGAILASPAVAQELRVVYEVRSQYQFITVQDTENGYRQMVFDGRFDGTDAIQSEMNLSDHDELTLSYARHIMAALAIPRNLRRVLIVGLGGASMQRYLRRLLPDATIETAEIDPEVRDVATKFFFFKEDDHQIVHLGDGRRFIENSTNKYDLIFLDAFSATSIPYLLTTQEFLKAVNDRLAPGGVLCANLWDEDAGYPEILKTYSTVFPELHVVKCASSGNSILVALPEKADLTVAAWVAKAETFEKAHATGLNLPQLIALGAARETRIPENARVRLDRDKGLTAAVSLPAKDNARTGTHLAIAEERAGQLSSTFSFSHAVRPGSLIRAVWTKPGIRAPLWLMCSA